MQASPWLSRYSYCKNLLLSSANNADIHYGNIELYIGYSCHVRNIFQMQIQMSEKRFNPIIIKKLTLPDVKIALSTLIHSHMS